MATKEIPIKRRPIEEMLEYTVERISKMQIDDRYKVELVGLLTAIQTEAEQKRGKWLPYEFGDENWHQCSVCGTADCYGTKYISFAGEKHIFFAVRNYCPICGARMEN